MAKKKRKSRKRAIKSKKYKDYNISTIRDHQQKGKTLRPPFSVIKEGAPIVFNSWIDSALPDVLWAALLTSQLERNEYLDLFRKVVRAGREEIEKYEDTYITHTELSELSDSDFDKISAPVLSNENARQALRGLRLFTGLPDQKHWSRHLPEPNPEEDWPTLAQAIADCFDHQSEKSTDCRWLKIIYGIAVGRINFPPERAKEVEEYFEYPNRGDMRSVRPSIRAMEMAFRGGPTGLEDSGKWNSDFWAECWEKTGCHIREPQTPNRLAHRTTTRALLEIYRAVVENFHETLEHTNVDARHDGTFGLATYAIYNAIALSRGDIAFRAEGRAILRTLIETFITLKYLSWKDDPTIWMQYRNYGTGQAKLSFLKHITTDDIPDYIELDDLEMHANADLWMEYRDIELGAWDNKNLRKMAQEAGIKDIYDKYYDWPSGFVHANWSAVRETNFELCLNPLHRFHRVVSFPRIDMNDALTDAGKLVNLVLDEVNKLYPPFKLRLKKEDQPTESTNPKSQE